MLFLTFSALFSELFVQLLLRKKSFSSHYSVNYLLCIYSLKTTSIFYFPFCRFDKPHLCQKLFYSVTLPIKGSIFFTYFYRFVLLFFHTFSLWLCIISRRQVQIPSIQLHQFDTCILFSFVDSPHVILSVNRLI